MAKKKTTKTRKPAKAKSKAAKSKRSPGVRKTAKTAKPRKSKATKRTKSPDAKMSQMDAAAKVLATADAPMSTKEMVEAMESKGLWSSPGGKTPAATLYSSLIRDIRKHGKESRFVKTDAGRFALRS